MFIGERDFRGLWSYFEEAKDADRRRHAERKDYIEKILEEKDGALETQSENSSEVAVLPEGQSNIAIGFEDPDSIDALTTGMGRRTNQKKYTPPISIEDIVSIGSKKARHEDEDFQEQGRRGR